MIISGFVYLIRKGDIYEIGQTKNLWERLLELKPDEILNVVRCSNFLKLELDLYASFESCRIPKTNQFKFNPDQIESLHLIIRAKSQL